MNDPISALFARDGSTTLAHSARPHAPVIREERMRSVSRRRALRLRVRRDRA
jgi:hypothetical protein